MPKPATTSAPPTRTPASAPGLRTGLTDPVQQAPDQANLQNGLDKLNDAIRNARAAPEAGLCMPGATMVWINGQTDTLWQPLTNNPDVFSRTTGWVALHLLCLKTAPASEANENLRDYQKNAMSRGNRPWPPRSPAGRHGRPFPTKTGQAHNPPNRNRRPAATTPLGAGAQRPGCITLRSRRWTTGRSTLPIPDAATHADVIWRRMAG